MDAPEPPLAPTVYDFVAVKWRPTRPAPRPQLQPSQPPTPRHKLQEVFLYEKEQGICTEDNSVLVLFALTLSDVRECCVNYKRFAFFGDGMLKGALIRLLWQRDLDAASSTDPGRLTQQKIIYECNIVLAAFLKQATDAPSLLRSVGVHYFDGGANAHTRGSIFEALLWQCFLVNGEQRAISVVRHLVDWVDRNIDPGMLPTSASSSVVWQSTAGRRFEERHSELGHSVAQADDDLERALFRSRVHAEIDWVNKMAPLYARESNGMGHQWTASTSMHVDVHGVYTANTWQGSMCDLCGAFLVARKVSNRASKWFLIGMEECPKKRASWLRDYRTTLTHIIDRDGIESLSGVDKLGNCAHYLRSWGFLK